MSGTAAEEAVVRYIKNFMQQLPLDSVSTTPYNILLSNPDQHNPNSIKIHGSNGDVLFETFSIEDSLKDQGYEYQGFNSYSASKTVKVLKLGSLV